MSRRDFFKKYIYIYILLIPNLRMAAYIKGEIFTSTLVPSLYINSAWFTKQWKSNMNNSGAANSPQITHTQVRPDLPRAFMFIGLLESGAAPWPRDFPAGIQTDMRKNSTQTFDSTRIRQEKRLSLSVMRTFCKNTVGTWHQTYQTAPIIASWTKTHLKTKPQKASTYSSWFWL